MWYDAHGDSHRTHSEVSVDAMLENAVDGKGHTVANDDIRAFIRDRESEIVVLVEGTDEITGSALQARHSYCWDEIAWDHTFVPCVYPSESERLPDHAVRQGPSEQPTLCIDFDKFHDIIPTALDCEACPYVPLAAR